MAQAPEAPSPASAPGPKDKHIILNQVLDAVKLTQELGITLDPDNPDPRLSSALANLYPDEIREALKTLEHSGDIYEPRPGYWKLVRADNVDE